MKRLWPWIGCVATGLLLAAAFAPLEQAGGAWIALLPLLLAVRGMSAGRAFRLGFLAGVIFWLFSVYWLIHVTVVGWIVLALYCALYLGVFYMLAARCLSAWGPRGFSGSIRVMFSLPLFWVATEYLRAVLFTGFPWNTLGVSQYTKVPMIQVAQWGGMYAVSALIVLVNVALALTIFRYVEQKGKWRRQVHVELMIAFTVLALVVVSGWRHLRSDGGLTRPFRAGLVQTNIPQDAKWDAYKVGQIYDRLEQESRKVLKAGSLDLVVWPETALPDDLRNSVESYRLVYDLATNGVPFLIGTMDVEWRDHGPPAFFNSSFLFAADGRIQDSYDKQHLVIFGEYVPLERWFPFMNALTPIQESFTAGTNSVVFTLDNNPVPFSVLICFEDTLPYLARRAVRAGARLLINQTNDAWFDPSSGSRQHMTHCVFRCVENGVPAFRTCNTGVTCAIDRYGRIHRVLEDDRGHTRFHGFLTARLDAPDEDMDWTFYTRYGDVFAGSALAYATAFILVGVWSRRRGCRATKLPITKDAPS